MCETLKNNNYQVQDELGRGRFGVISRCFSHTKNDYFVCKIINKNRITDPTDRECLEKEPKIMLLLPSHPNICQLHDVFDSDESLTLVLELCEPYTLYDRIVGNEFGQGSMSYGGVCESKAAYIMKEVLEALSHCHKQNVVHRDVKPDNILFDSRGRVKLSDFGSADWMVDGKVSGLVGTPYYVAPEVVMGREYGEKVDVWSAGVVLYVMLVGVPPFYGDTVEDIFDKVLIGNLRFPPRIFRGVSSSAKDLLRKMICRDVSRRFSADQALGHPWIVNGGGTNQMP